MKQKRLLALLLALCLVLGLTACGAKTDSAGAGSCGSVCGGGTGIRCGSGT